MTAFEVIFEFWKKKKSHMDSDQMSMEAVESL